MNTSKSLKEILEKHSLDVLIAAGIVYKRKLHEKNLLMLDDQARAAIVEAVEGLIPAEPWEWKPYNQVEDVTAVGLDPKEFDFKVCTVCGEQEFHPESVHECEIKDNIRADFVEAIKEWQ